jgi:glycosyltransferase involved in cell wall biosynthesis
LLQSLASTTFVCLPLNKIILAISEDLQFTIITVCKNSAKFLEETIMSVIEQTYPNIQYIVIDGGSTDGTIDIIKRYSTKINYWISEPDSGMYYAINKALLQATGDYILILNSDDVLVDSITIKTQLM